MCPAADGERGRSTAVHEGGGTADAQGRVIRTRSPGLQRGHLQVHVQDQQVRTSSTLKKKTTHLKSGSENTGLFLRNDRILSYTLYGLHFIHVSEQRRESVHVACTAFPLLFPPFQSFISFSF